MNSEQKPDQHGELYNIPAEGSLGLLALGAKGIELWRKKRNEIIQQHLSSGKTDQQDEKK